MTRGWMGARSQFDFGDEDAFPHTHPCEICEAPVACSDCCDDEQQTIVYCAIHTNEVRST